MHFFTNYELRLLDQKADEYALVVFLDDHYTEFSDELGSNLKENETLKEMAIALIRSKYPEVKVTLVKIMVGGMLVSSFPLVMNAQPASAQAIQTSTIFYQVVAGDTLWKISRTYNTTTDQIKQANQLSSDTLSLNQRLIIPKAVHVVKSGDTLSLLAKNYGSTTVAIREANRLTSDTIRIGQTLIIPTVISQSPVITEKTYTVVAGDSLSVIAKRFGTTVDALRITNNLKTDILQIGQRLVIPSNTLSPAVTPIPSVSQTSHTVVTGDTLWKIANSYSVSVDALRSVNKLQTDTLQIGQTLTITNGLNAPSQASVNTVSSITHTVVAGDNVWDLSIRYGIPQTELLRANNLSFSSMLSIGQRLTIPVHSIAVKPVISANHGELLDWSTEAQYVFPIGKTAKVTDFVTGKSFFIKRTIGANHADCETVSVADTNIAKSIWGGFSWTPRAVIVEVDGRKLAASMSFMPHERQYITNNGITGHFDVYFSNSTRHIDGKADSSHQAQVERAAGVR